MALTIHSSSYPRSCPIIGGPRDGGYADAYDVQEPIGVVTRFTLVPPACQDPNFPTDFVNDGAVDVEIS